MKAATDEQLETIRKRAYNQAARDMQHDGVKLTWEQADELGDEAIDWMRKRLGLKSSTSDSGITFKPDSVRATRQSHATAATSPEWVGEVVDAARPVLRADRDLALVTWPVGKQPTLYGSYKLRTARPGERPSSKLRPYFATLSKITGDNINGYVVVRYGDKIIVYLSPDTILARSEVA